MQEAEAALSTRYLGSIYDNIEVQYTLQLKKWHVLYTGLYRLTFLTIRVFDVTG